DRVDGGVTLEKTPDAGVEEPGRGCTGLQCQLAECSNGATTTISGVVYDPAGNNPLYNAQVYVPVLPRAALPAFTSGATCDTCGGTGAFNALRATQTDAAGRFTLSDVPAGEKIPVIVQMGKWRRAIVLSKVEKCTDNTVQNNCTAASSAD